MKKKKPSDSCEKVWMVGNHPVNLTPRRQEAPTSTQAGVECVHSLYVGSFSPQFKQVVNMFAIKKRYIIPLFNKILIRMRSHIENIKFKIWRKKL